MAMQVLMEKRARTQVAHFQNSNFKQKTLPIPQKLCTRSFMYTKKIFVDEIAAKKLSKIYFTKNAKEICKPNKRDLNRDWITLM